MKNRFYLFALSVLLCLTVTGCSGKGELSNEQKLFMINEIIPENITRIEVSGYHNGELEPWELDQEEIEELTGWLSELSLKHKTYGEGETPNKVWNGGLLTSLISTMANHPLLGCILIKSIFNMTMSGMKL